MECLETRGAPGSAFASEDRKEKVVVVSGLLMPVGPLGESGYGWVDVDAESLNLSVSGERRIFQLPSIGTMSLNESLRNEITAVVDGTGPLYVPDVVTIVMYGPSLAPTDQLEGMSIEPIARQPLTWGDAVMSNVTASGTIIDGRGQRDADRSIFVWGVIAGIVGGLILPVIGLWTRFFRARSAWRTD